jgi:hypothetical protein
VIKLTTQQLAYLRRVYRLCGAKRGACANSRRWRPQSGRQKTSGWTSKMRWSRQAASRSGRLREQWESRSAGGELLNDGACSLAGRGN